MAAEIVLLIILLITVLILALFSLNTDAVISLRLYLDTDNSENHCAAYAVSIKIKSIEIFRKTNLEAKNYKGSATKSGKHKGADAAGNVLYYIRSLSGISEIRNLRAFGSVALGDAAATALAAGALNALIGGIVGFLSTCAKETEIKCIDIRPDYSDTIKLDFFFECILRGNTGNIIITILNIVKGKNKNVKSNK